MKLTNIKLSPPRVLILSFVILSMIGTCLLKLPIATTTHVSWIDALFTTVSAFTVTGLGVVDTGTVFTLFGQLVILTLIQVGGLGIMSFAILIFMMFFGKIGPLTFAFSFARRKRTKIKYPNEDLLTG